MKHYLKVYDIKEDGKPDFSKEKILVISSSIYDKIKDLLKQEPESKLELLFQQSIPSYAPNARPKAFVWQGGYSRDGVSYGSYKDVYKDELKTRKYEVYLADYAPAIRYLDVWFDPVTSTYVSRNPND